MSFFKLKENNTSFKTEVIAVSYGLHYPRKF